MGERGSKFGDFITGAVIGGMIGYVIALLNAPAPGDETRMRLSERGRELRDRAVDTVQTTLDKTTQLVDEGRVKVEERVNRVRDRAAELKDTGTGTVQDVSQQARQRVSDTMRKAADKIDPNNPV